MATATDVEEDLRDLDRKVKQLRLDYERYFLGTRPRAPSQQRAEVDKLVAVLSNTPIQNTALRFKLNSIVSRYQAFKRQWEETLRKIDAGTYERHRFKAGLRQGAPETRESPEARADTRLFDEYRSAQLAQGSDAKLLTREKLEGLVAEHRARLAERFGPRARFRFRIAVQDGRTKLKASRLPQDT